MPLWQAPETHSYFGTLFRVPDSHTFSRNAASGNMIAQNALQSAAEFERFLRGDQPPLGGPSGRQIFRAASRPSRCESVNFVNSPIRSGTAIGGRIERFLRGDQPPLGGPSGRQDFRAASRPSRCESVNFVNSPIRSGTIGIDGVDERGVRFHPGNIGLCVTCVPKSNQIAIGAHSQGASRRPWARIWRLAGSRSRVRHIRSSM